MTIKRFLSMFRHYNGWCMCWFCHVRHLPMLLKSNGRKR